MSRTDWYSLLDIDGAEHPVTEQVFCDLEGDKGYREASQRLRISLARLVELLDGERKRLLLEYEESSNARTSLLVREHFNLGVEHGLAQEAVKEALTQAVKGEVEPGLEVTPAPAKAIQALAEEICRQTARLGTSS